MHSAMMAPARQIGCTDPGKTRGFWDVCP